MLLSSKTLMKDHPGTAHKERKGGEIDGERLIMYLAILTCPSYDRVILKCPISMKYSGVCVSVCGGRERDRNECVGEQSVCVS